MSIVSDGVFCVGVELDGQRFRKFSVRPARLGDSVAAVEELGSDVSPIRLRYAVMARRVSIEGLPPQQVTADLLMSLVDRDGVVLEQVADDVEKKLDELSSS